MSNSKIYKPVNKYSISWRIRRGVWMVAKRPVE